MSELQQIVDDLVAGGLPGAVALIDRSGQPEIAVAGVATADAIPMTAASLFRIASLTKPILGALTMCLIEDGALTLSDEVGRWVPELADPRVLRTPGSALEDTVPADRPITVEDLLTFRAGIGFPGDFSLPVVDLIAELVQQVPGQSVPAAGVADWLRQLAGVPLVHHPGAGWTYNTSADILGVVVARATDRDLPALMRDRILEPLGMVDTGFGVAPTSRGRLTDQWEAAGRTLVEPAVSSEFLSEPAFPSGAGGLVSTVGDLCRFGRMLLGGGALGDVRVLSPESVDALMTDQLTASQRASGSLFLDGQGWGYCGSVDGVGPHPWNVAGRYGWVGGTGTAAHVIPASDTVAILLTPAMLAGPTDAARFERFWIYSTAE